MTSIQQSSDSTATFVQQTNLRIDALAANNGASGTQAPPAGPTAPAVRPQPTVAAPRIKKEQQHRTVRDNKENEILRAALIQSWQGGNKHDWPPLPASELVARFEAECKRHPRWELPPIEPPTNNRVQFARESNLWNNAMAVWFVKNILIEQLNRHLPTTPVRVFDLRDREVGRLISKVKSAVKSRWNQLDTEMEQSRLQASRDASKHLQARITVSVFGRGLPNFLLIRHEAM